MSVSEPGQVGAGEGSAPPVSGRRRHLHLISRASWNLVDQVLSALTNMVLAVVVVHVAGNKAFDAFSVVFLLFATMIGIERALVGQPLGIRHSGDAGTVRRRTISRAMGLVVGVTVPAAGLMLGAGFLLGGRIGTTLMATSVVLPFLIMQDACRHAFFAAGEPKKAAFNDALWAVVQFSAMGVIASDMEATAPALVLCWGGAAAICVIVALIQLKAVPNPLATVSWLREHRDLVPYFLGEYMLTTGAFNGGYLTVGAIIGDQAVGSIRAAQVMLGPLQIIAGAGMSFGLPELSRRAESLSNGARRKIAMATSGAMAMLSFLYIGVLYVTPDRLWELLFDTKWAEAQEVLLPLSLAMVLSTAALGPSMVIYALGLARRTFRIMTIEAPLVFVLMIGGTLLYGVKGAVWGQFTDQAVVLLLWYGTLLGILASRAREQSGNPTGGSTGEVRDPSTRPMAVRPEPAAAPAQPSPGPLPHIAAYPPPEQRPASPLAGRMSAEGQPGTLNGHGSDRGIPPHQLPRR